MTTNSNTWNAELLSKFKATPTPVLDAVSQALVDEIDELKAAIVLLLAKRRLANATGVWLDNIGGIAGYPRPVALVADENIFTYSSLSFYAYVGNSTDGIEQTNVRLRVDVGSTVVLHVRGILDLSIAGDGEYQTVEIYHGANGPVPCLFSGDTDGVTGLQFIGSVALDLTNVPVRFPNLTEFTMDGGSPA